MVTHAAVGRLPEPPNTISTGVKVENFQIRSFREAFQQQNHGFNAPFWMLFPGGSEPTTRAAVNRFQR